MTTNTKHTPGPLMLERGGIISDAGRVVATAAMGQSKRCAEIVRAVNAHDDLVAALNRIYMEQIFPKAPGHGDWLSVAAIARAALEKAGQS